MQVLHCGYNYPHKKGEFATKKVIPFYFMGCFSTPFLYEVDGQLLDGNPGDLLVIPPGSIIYHGPISKDESFTNDWLYIEGTDFVQLMKKYPLPEHVAFNIGNRNLLKNCVQKIKEEVQLQRTGYEDVITSCLTNTIIDIYRLYQKQYHSDTSISRIESSREIIFRNLEKTWTLKEMADLSGYSVSRFSSLYVQRFGVSPKADLIQNRLQLAKQLLLYSELSVHEIAKQCGFQDICHFSKYFKADIGVAPSEYAKKLEKE